MTAYSLLQTLAQAPIIAKAAQDGGQFGKYVFFTNGTLNYVIPETFAQTAQRLYGIKDVNDDMDKQMPACWNVVNDRYNFVSRTITEALRDKSVYCDWCSYNKWGVASINDVEYVSKIADNENNDPQQSSDKWARGIKNTDMLPQRFNCWDVSIVDNTISLSSTSAFADYLFTEDQLVNGLKLSFIATTTLNGYSAGSSYTITVDGISKKLFESANEQEATIGGVINANELVTVYYNSAADNGNGAFFVVKTGGQAQAQPSKWHLVLDEIMKEEDPFDWFLMEQGYIKKSVGGLVDITDCAGLKQWLKNLQTKYDQRGTPQDNRTIIYDDKVWQQAAVEHNVNNPYEQFGKRRWSDKPLFGWRQTQDPTDREVAIDGNGFRLPLEYNLNPQPGEARVQVDQSFVISEDGKMAFRIEADGIKQRAIIQQAPHTPIANVPSTTPGANAALQFTLNNQQIFGPLFNSSNLNYYTGAYNYTNLTCPQVTELPASAQEGDYCYNTTDNKYYVYGAGGSWLDISTQTNTPHINFVAELPAVDVANVGELYVLNSEVGFVNSIQTLQYSYSAGSVANSAINSLKYGNWYNVVCPESTTPPENPATTPFYFEPNGQKYYAYKVVEQNGEQVGIWVDITASITQGASLPSSYNKGDYFVFTGTFGQANSLYVAVIEEFDSNNQALYTVGGSLDIHLLLQPDNAGYVDVNNVKVLATYDSSNLQWTIKVITITGSNLIGTYIGTEAAAQDYIKDIIATVAKTALGEIYTFIQSDGTTAIYDEQGTWKGGADGTISDSGQFLSWDGDKNYTRDTTHDTTAENWLRLANTVNIYFTNNPSNGYGAVCPQQAPNITGTFRLKGTEGSSDVSGAFRAGANGGSWGRGHDTGANNPLMSFEASLSNASYVDNGAVRQSAVAYALYVVVKDHDEVALRKQFANSVNPNASNVLVGELTINSEQSTDYSADVEVFVKKGQVGDMIATTSETYAANYMFCDGRAISRTTYAELFAKNGTKDGAGDGVTTFNIPDMRGRVAQGKRIDNDATYLEDGAPNITGSFGYIYTYKDATMATGCVSKTQSDGDKSAPHYLSSRNDGTRVSYAIDASKSNAVYGRSDVIQTKARQVNWFICVSQVPVENSGS